MDIFIEKRSYVLSYYKYIVLNIIEDQLNYYRRIIFRFQEEIYLNQWCVQQCYILYSEILYGDDFRTYTKSILHYLLRQLWR